MVPQLQRVLASTEVCAVAIHPAMVCTSEGGVFDRFARAAAEGKAVPVVAGEAVRWPLVHAGDLADLYALALEGDAIAAELGEWAQGYALDQRLSGAKARRDLGWSPKHLDPEGEILFGGPPQGPDTK
jgi:hypothetical protein